MSSIGPDLPPHLQKRKAEASKPEEPGSLSALIQPESPEEAGPSLPPHLLAARRAKAAQAQAQPSSTGAHGPSPSASSEVKRTYGPTLPGATPPPSRPVYGQYDDDDDDDVGPRPDMIRPGDREGDGVREFLEREERLNKLREVGFSGWTCQVVSLSCLV
jgi:hypothetical protein